MKICICFCFEGVEWKKKKSVVDMFSLRCSQTFFCCWQIQKLKKHKLFIDPINQWWNITDDLVVLFEFFIGKCFKNFFLEVVGTEIDEVYVSGVCRYLQNKFYTKPMHCYAFSILIFTLLRISWYLIKLFLFIFTCTHNVYIHEHRVAHTTNLWKVFCYITVTTIVIKC